MRSSRATYAGTLFALLALSACKANFSDFRKNGRASLVPDHFFSAFTSPPAQDCDGNAVTSNEGTAISVSRASSTNNYCTDASGETLWVMAANTPRVNSLGILVEGARTNTVQRNTVMGTGWTASNATVTANDGTNTVTATVPNLTGRTIDVRVFWSGSSMTVVADGVTASGSFDGSFSSTATMHIGRTSAGSGYANAYIKNIKVGARASGCIL